ncbi:MAG: tRNA pseudouridine(55) synthase TruB [Bacteroidota bacterium]
MNAEEIPLKRYDFVAGATLLVNKPEGWTSFDVVNKIRYKLKKKLKLKKLKVGHSGTLDPMATGLLVICTGKFTKKLTNLQGLPKEYTGTMHIGATTPSYDAETEVDERFPIDHITPEMIEEARNQFIGKIEQVPPMFSAIKVDGQPLYKKARKGEKIEIEARTIKIEAFDLTRIEIPEIDFCVACSKGTYIRSLAHDFGKAVRSGAHLISLKRTKVGDFDLKDAWELDDLIKHIKEMPEEV